MIDSLIFENGWGKPTALRPRKEKLSGNETRERNALPVKMLF